jgi:cytoskeletal protein CcmA (bactofilin family)
MFSKDGKADTGETTVAARLDAARRSNGGSTLSVINRDLKITGDLATSGDLQIDGEVEGDVQSRSVTIGENAAVRGTVSGDNVRIYGSFNGQLKGQSVVLGKTAKLVGDVTHKTLTMEPGATFEGQSRPMGSAKS